MTHAPINIAVNDLFIFYRFPKPRQEPHSRNRDLIYEKISEFITEENDTELLVPPLLLIESGSPFHEGKQGEFSERAGSIQTSERSVI